MMENTGHSGDGDWKKEDTLEPKLREGTNAEMLATIGKPGERYKNLTYDTKFEWVEDRWMPVGPGDSPVVWAHSGWFMTRKDIERLNEEWADAPESSLLERESGE